VRVERGVVKRAAQLVALADELGREGLGDAEEVPHPIFWPAMRPDEAHKEWNDLRCWVDQLRTRYPNLTRIPDCWWRHNDLVEVLAALRDFERGCFYPLAPATAAVEWQRALRDMEVRMEIWIKRLTCAVAGRGHDAPMQPVDVVPDGWVEFVDQDAARRPAAAHRAPVPDS
jgi:hypothetical protein